MFIFLSRTFILQWNQLITWHNGVSYKVLPSDCSTMSLTYIWTQSFSWMEPVRILLLGTLMHHVKTVVGSARQRPWPIFDLGHDLISINYIDFWTSIPEWNQLIGTGLDEIIKIALADICSDNFLFFHHSYIYLPCKKRQFSCFIKKDSYHSKRNHLFIILKGTNHIIHGHLLK